MNVLIPGTGSLTELAKLADFLRLIAEKEGLADVLFEIAEKQRINDETLAQVQQQRNALENDLISFATQKAEAAADIKAAAAATAKAALAQEEVNVNLKQLQDGQASLAADQAEFEAWRTKEQKRLAADIAAVNTREEEALTELEAASISKKAYDEKLAELKKLAGA